LTTRIQNYQSAANETQKVITEYVQALNNQAQTIKSLEASEKKYVDAAAKLVETTKERDEWMNKCSDRRRSVYSISKLVKTAIQTLESARELVD
jgi:flagellar biosynthesis chaperone FliJ